MKTLLLPLATLVPLVVLASVPNSYTWKGGTGRWDDPAMWTAGDGSETGYPHDDSLDTAVFPAAVKAEVTIPDGTAVSNLLILAENSDVRFVAPPGCTNAMTYRAFRAIDESTGEWIGACGANATFALERVRLWLKIGDKTERLFTASTASGPEVEARTLDGPKDGSVVRLADGSYLSMLMNSNTGKDKERISWEVSSGAELHAALLHLGGGSTLTLDDGYLTVWYLYTDTFSFDGGMTVLFKGAHPRLVYGRISSAYPFSDSWNAAVGGKAPNVGTLAFHLPPEPYAQAPFGNSSEGSEAFPGGAFTLRDSGETDLTIPADVLKIVLSETNVAREGAGDDGVRYDLIDWSGLSWKKTRLSIKGAANVIVKGMRRDDAVESTVLDDWAAAGVTDPQRWGVRIRRAPGALFIIR